MAPSKKKKTVAASKPAGKDAKRRKPGPSASGTYEEAGMGSSPAGGGDIFDVDRVRKLVELMNEHDLTEVDLRQSDQRVRIRKGADQVFVSGGPMPAAASAPAPMSAPAASAAPASAAADESHLKIIKSPMVGTFYRAANPESKPFVEVGGMIGPDSPVCMVEAMKVFNEIPAEISGKIVSVLVENGAPVEYDQPLFKVDTRS